MVPAPRRNRRSYTIVIHRRVFVVDRPQAHDHGSRTRDVKRAPQAEHALADADLADAGITRRQHGPFDGAQIERRDLFGGQNAVFIVDAGSMPTIGAGEAKPGEEQRVLANLGRCREIVQAVGSPVQRGGTQTAKKEPMGREMENPCSFRSPLDLRFRCRAATQNTSTGASASCASRQFEGGRRQALCRRCRDGQQVAMVNGIPTDRSETEQPFRHQGNVFSITATQSPGLRKSGSCSM
jgi:hypothetical protein